MGAIQSFFVRSKHWQVFAIVFGLFCCANAVLLLPAFNGPKKSGLSMLDVIGVLTFYACFTMWYWSMGSFICSIVEPTLRPKLRFFCFAIVYPLAYLLVFNLFFDHLTPIVFLAIFPFHLLAMFCLLYTPAFIARNLAVAETGRALRFRDYAGTVFLVWFFPIGIWFVQPRINRLYANPVPVLSC